ncbi:MAG: 16S rRNA (cytosine(967)-C(5))-methyltransferase RsmB [Solirubrobacterales bacterium]|nr:16S rRNA (cytosine(967)-C(5))-methyltransferase RsmB [Solirubrobacterales bacterium]
MAERVSQVSPARVCAFAVVRRVFEEGAYADRAWAAEAEGLSSRDRALAMQIAYGTVQRRLTLDALARRLLRRPLESLQPVVLAGLRIGVFQLLFLQGVATHAAVDDTVELVKRQSPGGAGLVNAVLRRAAREGTTLLDELSDATVSGAALAHSVPEWLVELWWQELGESRARSLLRVVNQPAERALRVNLLRATPEEVQAGLPVPAHLAPELPEGLVLDGAFDVPGSAWFRRGAIMPQSRGSMLVARILAPEPGQEVLDLCAAPGGKTTHLAALMEDRGRVVAVERHPGRASALRETCARLGTRCVEVLSQDALELAPEPAFHRVLLDPPCSGLGTLQSRPDRRWRARAEAIGELAELQGRLLEVAAAATRPGGRLVYSVCTISQREGSGLIDAFLASAPDWEAEDLGASHPQWIQPGHERYLQLLPDRDGTDGFFIARLRRYPPDGGGTTGTLPSSA